MTTVLLIVHLFVTLALIGVVLIQRSEGGGLGVGTSQGMGSFMSGRGTANLLTRTTAILATAFFVLSMALALLNRGTTVRGGSSILDAPPASTAPAVPATPTSPAPKAPASATPPVAAPPVATPPVATVPAPAAPVSPTPATPAPATKQP
jgi:preprotein translocase subunit SecG